MHTSSGVDNVDEFAEKVERRGKGYCYWYGATCRPSASGPSRSATGRRTDGSRRAASPPSARIADRSFASDERSLDRLRDDGQAGRSAAAELPSHQGDRPRLVPAHRATLKANSSNNTLFADDKGEIAYLHPQFVPAPRQPLRLYQAGRRQRSRDRLERRCMRSASCRTSSIRRTAGSRTPMPGPIARPAPTAPTRRSSRITWTRTARTSAAFTRSRC